jgi:hypothetical protein
MTWKLYTSEILIDQKYHFTFLMHEIMPCACAVNAELNSWYKLVHFQACRLMEDILNKAAFWLERMPINRKGTLCYDLSIQKIVGAAMH